MNQTAGAALVLAVCLSTTGCVFLSISPWLSDDTRARICSWRDPKSSLALALVGSGPRNSGFSSGTRLASRPTTG